MRKLAWLTAIVTLSATWAPMAHLLELPNKFAMPGPLWLQVQQRLYNGWGPLIGAPTEIGGLVLCIAMAIAARQTAGLVKLYSVAAAMFAGMLLCFFLLDDQVNKALAGAQTLPANWTQDRLNWETGHAIAALFSFCGLVFTTQALLRVERDSTD
jgi:hypothetical protein